MSARSTTKRSTAKHRALVLSLAAASVVLSAQSANALTFNFVPAAGMSQQAIDGFAAAGERWSSIFSDPVTVNISIDFRSLGAGILGQASSTSTAVTYTNTRSGLSNDRVSADDFTAYGSLPATTGVKMLINRTANNPNGAGSATPYIDNDNDSNNVNLDVNYANARALGLVPAVNATSDAAIAFSSNFTWDFDPKNGITGGAFDFVGVATHEIGHALGFISGVDVLDTNSSGTFYNDDVFDYVSTPDLFRFSAQSISDGGAGTVDFAADSRSKFFSIDGGATPLADFSTGSVWGDGRQASHWKDNLAIGVMDPTAAPGELMLITARDRQLFDVIGWNLSNSWNWIDPAGGNFNSGIRWSATATPGSLQDANFKLNSAYAINFTAAAASKNAFIRAGTITFQLSNPYTVSTALNVAPVAGDVATLNLLSGTLSAASVGIGGDTVAAGGTGTVSLDVGSQLNVSGNLRVWNNGLLKYNGGNTAPAALLLNGGKIQSTTSAVVSAPITSTGGTIQTDSGTFTINGQLTTTAAATLTKTGNGTLNILGPQSHGAGAAMTFSAGATQIATNAGNVSSPGTLTINANSTVDFSATQNLAALNVGAGATATLQGSGSRSIKASSVSVDPTSKLDLQDNRLIVDYTGGTVEGTIRPLLASGFNSGTWDGFGIQSAVAGSTLEYGLGYAEASDVISFGSNTTAAWGGQTVDTTSLLIRFSYMGDGNLDGTINADDYALIDLFSQLPNSSGYSRGDFNYDAAINADDYAIIDINSTRQAGPLGARPGAPDELFATGEPTGMTAVPEPTGLMLVAAGSALLARRRRR